MTASLEQEVRVIAEAAKAAAASLAQTSADVRNNALAAMAAALRVNRVDVLAANAQDMDAARAAGTQESLLDRLMLDEARIEAMAGALEELVALSDPLGRVQEQRTLESGIQLTRVSVPLGVVAVVYEARPNVTADAAESAGMPAGCIGIIESTDRAAADVLMSLHGIVDVLVPRGGAGLIRHCVECAKVPVIETGTGNCHVYVHETADFARARNIVVNAKCRRYGVCNACETLLVDEAVALDFLPELFGVLADKGVHIHGDELACKAALAAGADRLPVGPALRIERATEADWGTEYLAPELAVRCVSGVDQAIAHINRYGTKHSEAIVADEGSAAGAQAIERFVNEVDAAAVYVNASTAFTDGGMFGLGAEIGISTQKLHVRGPFALEGLTSYKYVLCGTGQIRA